MPRSSSPAHRSSVSSSKPATPVPIRSTYPSISATPAPMIQAPTLGQSIKEGFGLGAGSAIAHRVVNSILGPPTVSVTTASATSKQPERCEKERTAFENCMKTQSMDTFCGQEQIAYTECLRIAGPKNSP